MMGGLGVGVRRFRVRAERWGELPRGRAPGRWAFRQRSPLFPNSPLLRGCGVFPQNTCRALQCVALPSGYTVNFRGVI